MLLLFVPHTLADTHTQTHTMVGVCNKQQYVFKNLTTDELLDE